MERPDHTLDRIGTASQQTSSRFSGVVIVIVIHAAIGALLLLAMNADKIEKKIADLQATVEQRKVPPKVPPPPPPKFEKPPPPFVPPPDVNIQTEAPPPRVVTTPTPPPPAPPPRPAPTPAPPAAPPAPPEIIAATHTKPPYPPISQRLGEHGDTTLNVSIDETGRAVDATVAISSGFARLDQAAIDYVKQRYRWKPATRDGKPVADKLQIKIQWNLADAE